MHTDQPQPVTSQRSRPVGEALKALIDQRTAIGIERYGQALHTHNGRDAHRDALEEALDLCQYMMQMVMEDEDDATELAAAIAADLFTCGDGKRVHRLMLAVERDGGLFHDNLGGWSQTAVVNRVAMIIAKYRRPRRAAK